jgi:hypothetical protein
MSPLWGKNKRQLVTQAICYGEFGGNGRFSSRKAFLGRSDKVIVCTIATAVILIRYV